MKLSSIFNKLDNWEVKSEGYFPFTPLNIAYNKMDKKVSSILDLGCGKGYPMLYINRKKRYHTVGVDVFKEYIDNCKRIESHDKLILDDVLEVDYNKKVFDVVLGLRILEHFTKEEGYLLLHKMESVAKKQVILITPIEDYEQTVYDNNTYQEHKCIWKPEELKERGFKIYYNGIKGFQKDTIKMNLYEKLRSYMGHFLWVTCGWLPVIYPKIASNVVAVKNL